MMMNSDNKSAHLNILIVDDEANIRKTLTVCLESRGHPCYLNSERPAPGKPV